MKVKWYHFHIFSIGVALLLIIQYILPASIVFAADNDKNTTIGGITITVKKESEIQSILSEAVSEWKSNPLIVKGQTGSVEIPIQMIQFDIQGSVQNYLQESIAPWYMPWKKRKIVHLPLNVEVSDEVDALLREIPFFQIEETRIAIANDVQYLKTDPVEAVEGNVTKENMDRAAFEIQQIPKSRTSLSALVAMLDGLVLAENEVFSFLDNASEMTNSTDIEARRFFASVLYSVVLQAETSIVERHSQNKIPTYLQPGIEVDVSERLQKDFAFQNSSTSPMLFSAKIENNNLVIELYTFKNEKTVTYSVVEKKVEPKTIYRLSSKLKSNQSSVVEQGSAGYRVTVYRTFQDASHEMDEEVSRDFYAPVHKIVNVSSLQEEVGASSNTGESTENSEKNPSKGASIDDDKDSSPNKDKENHQDDQSGESKDGEQEEIIYDKGGNIINDPNI